MVTSFFSKQGASDQGEPGYIYLLISDRALTSDESKRLEWLIDATALNVSKVAGPLVGPRKEMVTPWSTNACEMAENVGVTGVRRIEEFVKVSSVDASHDRMLQMVYKELNDSTLQIDQKEKASFAVQDLNKFNIEFGLALSDEEITYLENASNTLGRPLTDTEVYAFGQINSEHCRHKIFRGEFVIDGERRSDSLFSMIKATSKKSPDNLVSAYSDNVAFIKGPDIVEFTTEKLSEPSEFIQIEAKSILSLKAETHNFPTTVEPFNGASTGSGGEIRDRLAGGQGSIPLSGTAVYMTSYPRLKGTTKKFWEEKLPPRKWRYQSPEEILIKASDGASDFGNKFGQPLLVGSLLTMEIPVDSELHAYDRMIMLAGGVGYARAEYSHKQSVEAGDVIVLLGGDNYRIGMAGASASSIDTGVQSEELELSAVQRANAEMQKRVANVIRLLAEHPNNPIKSIHDHGAGGHMNCFTELLENTGGRIDVDALPVGDPTLSLTELLCNESQERMGLIIGKKDIEFVRQIAERERAPFYIVGEVTGDGRIEFVSKKRKVSPVSLPKEVLLGSSPKLQMTDSFSKRRLEPLTATFSSAEEFREALYSVLSLEGVACKDWLTNKVDRCVTAQIAQQQCVGPLQLPLSGYSISTLDYVSHKGIVTSLGHAPGPALVDASRGSILAIAEALTNIVFAPLENGLESIVLSANWMWPAKQPGEDARLYEGVKACSDFAMELGLSIPTGKDSLSMTMKYRDGSKIKAPGTVIITAVGATDDFTLKVTPELKPESSKIFHIPLNGSLKSRLGGSSYAQTRIMLGDDAPNVDDIELFKRGFAAIQKLLRKRLILAGHDVSSGGLVTTLVEMSMVGDVGCSFTCDTEMLFAEEPGLVIQISEKNEKEVLQLLTEQKVSFREIGKVQGDSFELSTKDFSFKEDLSTLRHIWFEPSYLLDKKQCVAEKAVERFSTISSRHLKYNFPAQFTGQPEKHGVSYRRQSKSGKARAAVIRDKGTNGDRELAFAFYSAGFDVLDVTMSDMVAGRETLENVQVVGFPGGFSNSDVLGSGKGWAGTFLYNDRAMQALNKFVSRPDTLLLGICNGCQVVGELELLYPEHKRKLKLRRNASKKFESAFVNVDILPTNNVFLKDLVGSKLGVWVAHGEGRFDLPEGEAAYDIPIRYSASSYPANPNGSPFNAAGISAMSGRALILMPHPERSIFPWNWGYYPRERMSDEMSPWLLAFRSAYEWCVQA